MRNFPSLAKEVCRSWAAKKSMVWSHIAIGDHDGFCSKFMHAVRGQMIAPTIGATRTEENFPRHIHNTISTDREAGWLFVVDNLNTHCSERLVHYIASLEGIDVATLGKKGRW